MLDTNPTHQTYLMIKPIMQQEFPMLFAKETPLVKRFRWVDYLYETLTKRGVKVGALAITRRDCARFFRCWTHRKEYYKAIAESTHRIDEAGYPIEVISYPEETSHAYNRYRRICEKQGIIE